MSEDELISRRLNERFEQAKRTSDFVGMLTRVAFLSLLVSFLFNAAEKSDGIYAACYALAALFLMGIAIVFVVRIVKVVELYDINLFHRAAERLGKGKSKLLIPIRLVVYIVMAPILFGLIGGAMKYGDKLAERLDIEQHDAVK